MRRPSAAAAALPAFTLIELVVVIAIVAVLAGISVPNYADHVRRGRLIEAVTRLADHRVRLEQYFLDNRRYDDGAGACGFPPQAPEPGDAFRIDCTASAATYAITATGLEGRGAQGFAYAVDHANTRRTLAVPAGWVGSDRCWVLRRDGSCG